MLHPCIEVFDSCDSLHTGSHLFPPPGIEELHPFITKNVCHHIHIAAAELLHQRGRNVNLTDAGFVSILDSAGIHDPGNLRPNACREAHGARFAGAVHRGHRQFERLDFTAGFSDRLNFRMSGRVHG